MANVISPIPKRSPRLIIAVAPLCLLAGCSSSSPANYRSTLAEGRKIATWHNLLTLEMGVTSLGTALVYMPVHRWEIIVVQTGKDAPWDSLG